MADWMYDAPATTRDAWPTFALSGSGWGSLTPVEWYYDHTTPLVGQSSFVMVLNHSIQGYHPVYGTVTRITNMIHCWGETVDDYIAMPGLTEGRLRILVQITRNSGSGRHFFGLSCLNSTDELEETGLGYGMILEGALADSTWETVRLVAFPGPNGLRSPYTTLLSVPFSGSLSTPVALELLWTYFPADDRLTLTARRGTALDYSDLATVLVAEVHPTLDTPNVTQGVCMMVETPTLTDGDMAWKVDELVMEGGTT